ncbi:HEM4 [Sanghuangporus sanghuang]
MSHVLLLRAPTDGKADAGKSTSSGSGKAGEDSYETLLAPATSIPVYETQHTPEELQWILETGPAFHGYNGVIVTSKRAVDAWAAASKKVPVPADERAHWTDIPFYAVGGATAQAVRDLSNSGAPHLAPRQVLGGEESGTGEQLAHFILTHLAAQRDAASTYSTSASSVPGSYSSTSLPLTGSVSTDNLSIFTKGDGQPHTQRQTTPEKDEPLNSGAQNGTGEEKGQKKPLTKPKRSRSLRRPMKLLFLVGDKTRDALPTILSSDESIELDSVQVYATKPSPNFPNALRSALHAQSKVKDWWIVIFAPSGADYAIPFLREHFTLPSSFSSPPVTPSSAYSSGSLTYPPSTPTSPSSTSNLTPSSSSKSKKKDKKKDKDKDKDKSAGGGGQHLPTVRFAAIGPTTATHLREVCKVEVAAVAAKPNAEALAAAIKAASASAK